MTGKNLYLVLYVAVSLLCVSISVYLSYWGYLSHLRELTLVFAVLIGLLLFGADMLIRQTLVEQRSLFLQLLFFGVILIFSGASNFNFLYTNFMASTIAERAVRDQFETFRSDLTATQRRLIGQEVVQEHLGRRQLIEAELENLRQQLGDPLRPGCGERCEAHLEAINGLLGGAPTDLARPPVDAGAAVQMAWYGNYRTVVLQDFEARWGSGRVATSLRVSARIDQFSRAAQRSGRGAARATARDGQPAAARRGLAGQRHVAARVDRHRAHREQRAAGRLAGAAHPHRIRSRQDRRDSDRLA
jgi:hypothetical protein